MLDSRSYIHPVLLGVLLQHLYVLPYYHTLNFDIRWLPWQVPMPQQGIKEL